jgi:GxxExxY protein
VPSTNDQRDPLTYAIIGAAMEVHRELGCGFLEAVYQEAIAVELTAREVPFRKEVMLPVYYKEHQLPTGYRADFVCYGKIIVELKALAKLTTVDDAQLLNYLKATGFESGLIINFGGRSLEWRRLVNSARWTPGDSIQDQSP